jgi:hypothetical protein
MAETDVTHVDAVIKEFIAPGITDQFLEEKDLFNRIERGAMQRTNSRGVTIVNRTRRNASFGAIGESGTLPTSGRSEFNQFKVFPTSLFSGWRVSRLAVANCKGDAGSLIDVLSFEMDACLESARAKINDAIPLDGTGEIARVKSRDSGTAFTCESTAAGGNMFGNIKILANAKLNFYDPVGQAYRATPTDSIVSGDPDPSASTVTVDSLSAAVAQGDRVCFAGSYNRYPHGFDALINNGSGMIQGQSRASFPNFRSVTFDARNADPTVALFNKVRGLLKFRHSSPDKTTLVSSIGVKVKYEEQGHGLSRFQRTGSGGTMKLDFGNVQHGPMGSGWEDYTVIQPNIVWGVDFSDFNKYPLEDFGPLSVNGQTAWLGVTSGGGRADYIEGWCGSRFDLGTPSPKSHFRINNIGTSDQPLAQLAY